MVTDFANVTLTMIITMIITITINITLTVIITGRDQKQIVTWVE